MKNKLEEIPSVREAIENYYNNLQHWATSAHKRKEVRCMEKMFADYRNFINLYYKLGYPAINHVQLIEHFGKGHEEGSSSSEHKQIELDSEFLKVIMNYRDNVLFGSILSKFDQSENEQRRKFWKFIDKYDGFIQVLAEIFNDKKLLEMEIDE